MKVIITILVFLFSLNIFFTPNVFAQDAEQSEVVDIYALFWPIVPGTTVADSTFWAKQLKEGFSGFFTFGDVSKSQYQINLSEKRLVEANKLVENKDFSNALKSLKLNESNRTQAVSLKNKAKEENKDVNELSIALVKSLENQSKALRFLSTQFSDDQKSEVQEMIEELTLQISEAK